MATVSLSKLVMQLTADSTQLKAELSKANGELRKFKTAADGVWSQIKTGLQAAVAGISLAHLVGQLKEATNYFSGIVDMANRLGDTAENMATLDFAAQLTGAGSAEQSITKLQDVIATAASGGKEAQSAFARLGVSIEEMARKSPTAQLEELADAFANVASNVEKVALARDLFGKSGAQMLPMLNELRDAQRRARELGVVPPEDQMRRLEGMGDVAAERKMVTRRGNAAIADFFSGAYADLLMAPEALMRGLNLLNQDVETIRAHGGYRGLAQAMYGQGDPRFATGSWNPERDIVRLDEAQRQRELERQRQTTQAREWERDRQAQQRQAQERDRQRQIDERWRASNPQAGSFGLPMAIGLGLMTGLMAAAQQRAAKIIEERQSGWGSRGTFNTQAAQDVARGTASVMKDLRDESRRQTELQEETNRILRDMGVPTFG